MNLFARKHGGTPPSPEALIWAFAANRKALLASVQVVRYSHANSGTPFPAQTSTNIQIFVDTSGGAVTVPLPASLIDGTSIIASDDSNPGAWGTTQPGFTASGGTLINNPNDSGTYGASVSPPAISGNKVQWTFNAVKGLYE